MKSQAKQPARLPVKLPADLKPHYANLAMITNSASEIVFDFAQVMPRVAHATVGARVIMTAMNAKLLLGALTDHMTRYEDKFGEIKLPDKPHLADQLFGQPPPESPEEE
jgi:hypothetical protein